ncbi:hypothetical protein NDU88_004882 [Pleurodeles waltl]|uniref:Uncharacterized protein n=1 Tax=Pleurodeles waltl TaxID=8319 RepID=A0AAV7UKI0_PLEWA|nr:hypothetical protein NDU88_004882 [Pleurodeles waltl]
MQGASSKLEGKINELASHTEAIEKTEQYVSMESKVSAKEIQDLEWKGKDLQEKLERLENNARRNNIRIFNVPEGAEGNDLKFFMVKLLREALPQAIDTVDLDSEI